jgi:DNA-binding transcriptional LysR family regulator
VRLIGVLGALLKLNFVYPYIRKLNKLSRIELRHVRSFLSLAKTLSFSRTAEIVHLSQPALSLQIQALEEEIAGKLFERDRRRTVLTAAGVAFQNEAGGGLAQLEQAIQSARLALKGKMGCFAPRISPDGWS